MIHIDPKDERNPELHRRKDFVEKCLASLEPQAHIHDFRMEKEGEWTVLVFDLVVPYSYKKVRGRKSYCCSWKK